jgi:hypothetical protein
MVFEQTVSNFADYQTFIKKIATKYLSQPTNVLFDDEEVSLLYYLMYSQASPFVPEIKFPTLEMVKYPITKFWEYSDGDEYYFNYLRDFYEGKNYDEKLSEKIDKELKLRQTKMNALDVDLSSVYSDTYTKYMLRRISSYKTKNRGKGFVHPFEIVSKLITQLDENYQFIFYEVDNYYKMKDKSILRNPEYHKKSEVESARNRTDEERRAWQWKRQDWEDNLKKSTIFCIYIAMDKLLKKIHDKYGIPWQLTKYTVPSKFKANVDILLPLFYYEKIDNNVVNRYARISTVIKNLNTYYNTKTNKDNPERKLFNKNMKARTPKDYAIQNYNLFFKPMYTKILDFLKTDKIEPMFLEGLPTTNEANKNDDGEKASVIARKKLKEPVTIEESTPKPKIVLKPLKPVEKPVAPPRTKKPPIVEKPVAPPRTKVQPIEKPVAPPRTKKPPVVEKPVAPPRKKQVLPDKPKLVLKVKPVEKPVAPPRTKKPPVVPTQCEPVLAQYLRYIGVYFATLE